MKALGVVQRRLADIDAIVEDIVNRKCPEWIGLFGYKPPNENPWYYPNEQELERQAFNAYCMTVTNFIISLLYFGPVTYYLQCDMHLNAMFYSIAVSSTFLHLVKSYKLEHNCPRHVICC